ncbi:MAG: sporulation integral membrane protein YtvI [Oscillospiraceae bacterium]|nr:sporulation integral membrane protein YtvI [Oscillospiraceae bacterium]
MAKHQQVLIWVLYIALGIAALWLGFRFVLPWAAPFLLALLTARLMEPAVRWMMRRMSVRRGFAAAVCSLAILSLMLCLVGLLISQLVNGIGTFARNLPEIAGQLGQMFGRLERSLYHFVIAAPVETQAMIQTAIDSFASMLEEMPGQLSAGLVSFAASVAAAFPRFLLFVLTYAISVIFMSVSYPQITEFLLRQIPARWHERARGLGRDIVSTLGKWAKAQIKLMGVTFVLLTVAFLALGVSYGILLAALIAVIDALPVFGTGTVLIPWALFSLLGGNFTLGIGLALTYAAVSITHSFMEPRFIGQQLGLHPVATLMAMYLGFRLVGVLGMITFPMVFLLLKQFHDQGHVKLWR